MDRPQLDESKASEYVGKTVLVGISYLDHNEKLIEQKQWYGVIETYSNSKGIKIRSNHSDQPICLTPDPSCLIEAKPGTYRLRSTGEEIEDPDYLTMWTRVVPDPNKSK